MTSTKIWERKYKTSKDNSPEDTFRRVANFIADSPEEAKVFFEEMDSLRFLPGGRILAYAGSGNPKATLSNCFVMGSIEDSMEGIMNALHEGAVTMKAGGGIGMNFSTLRPYGEKVVGTNSISSGPVSFMDMWNAMSRTISGVGDRKGAMIGVLNCDHPDIERFISAKVNNDKDNPVLEKFNISVGITDEYIRAVKNDGDWELKFDNKTYKTIKARQLWAQIIENNYKKAEPGVLFLDNINKFNNLWYIEKINACNPCGEQPLPPYGACTLGAINLTQFVNTPFREEASINYEALKRTVRLAVRFLDNTVDKNFYPLVNQAVEAHNKRRIGLGIMGLGSALAMLGVRYGSDRSLEVVEEIMRTIRDTAYAESCMLAKEKGAFPLFDAEKYLEGRFIQTLPEEIRQEIKNNGIRNACLLTIAPTGSLSQLAGNVSGGVEPIYQVRFYRRNYGQEFMLEDYAYKLYKSYFGEPKGLPPYFVSALELTPEEHLKVMAVCQRYVDASISKTINLPKNITVKEMEDIYIKAWEMGLKGCTVYREGSLSDEILSTKKTDEKQKVHTSVYTRPYKLEGKTYKVKVPEQKHAYYLTFTMNEKRKPIELFINTKDPTVEEWTRLVGRVVSAVFRNVDDPTFLIDEFREIYGPSGFFSSHRRKFIPSLQAEFGEVMKDFFTEIGLLQPEVPVEVYAEEINGTSYSPQPQLAYCKVCGKHAGIFKEGCFECLACGYNKCG